MDTIYLNRQEYRLGDMCKMTKERGDNEMSQWAMDFFPDSKIIVRNAGIFRFPAAYRFAKHNHKEVEINYIRSGHCIMGVGNTFIPLKAGCCIMVCEGVPHSFIVENKEKCSIVQLEFYVEIEEEFWQRLGLEKNKNGYYKFINCEMVSYLMESLCRMNRIETPYKELQMKLGFFQLFLELSGYVQMEQKESGAGKKTRRLDEIIWYINENYEQDFSIEQLAEQFGISSRYLRKCFADETGISCQNYINSLRISKAKELLWFTDQTVTEIAMQTGFNSTQYFCRMFQQCAEMSPREYRNLWKGSKAEELCVFGKEAEDFWITEM